MVGAMSHLDLLTKDLNEIGLGGWQALPEGVAAADQEHQQRGSSCEVTHRCPTSEGCAVRTRARLVARRPNSWPEGWHYTRAADHRARQTDSGRDRVLT